MNCPALYALRSGWAVFDERGCGLRCLAGQPDAPPACTDGEPCRFGVYKLQKGFAGYVPWTLIELGRMYPVLEIWRREGALRARPGA